MKKCSILISITHELVFLKRSIIQIRKYKHPEIDQEIIITDQSDEKISLEIKRLYGDQPDIKIIKIPMIDVGYSMDVACKIATGEYFCSLDGDAFPIHKNWLFMPISLIEKYGFSFIGNDVGMAQWYKEYGKFICISNYFRVSKTSTMVKISEDVGFVRLQNRHKVNYIPKVNIEQFALVSENNRTRKNVDSAVIAQWYADHIKMGDKLSLPINKMLGATNKQGLYGFCPDDMVFHMSLWRKLEDKEHSKVNKEDEFGTEYLRWFNLINKEGITDAILEKILSELKPYVGQKRHVNGNKLLPESELNQYIEFLKNA